MIGDFVPVIHTLKGRTVKLWAVGDVHIGAAECDLGGFEKFLRSVESDPDSYICILGDLLNNGLRDSMTNVYQEILSPSAACDKAVELLAPVKDKILGVTSGNHERRSLKCADLDPLLGICYRLGIEELYRENMVFMRINLVRGNTKDHYAIMLTHGKTAAKRKAISTVIEGIDAVIVAHTHTPDISMPAVIRFGQNNKLSIHNIVSMTACSWLRPGGYSLANCYVPQATSTPQCLELEFTGSNSKAGRIRTIW